MMFWAEEEPQEQLVGWFTPSINSLSHKFTFYEIRPFYRNEHISLFELLAPLFPRQQNLVYKNACQSKAVALFR